MVDATFWDGQLLWNGPVVLVFLQQSPPPRCLFFFWMNTADLSEEYFIAYFRHEKTWKANLWPWWIKLQDEFHKTFSVPKQNSLWIKMNGPPPAQKNTGHYLNYPSMVFKVCRPKTGDAKGGVASNGNSAAKLAKMVLVVASLCGWRCSLAVGFVLKDFRRGSSILVTVSWKTEVYQRFWGDFCWSVWILRKVHKNHGFGVWAKSRFPGLPHQFYCEGFQVKIRYTLNFFLMKWHFCKDDYTKTLGPWDHTRDNL